MEAPPDGDPTGRSWAPDASAPPRCSVFVAHRRDLRDSHRTLLNDLETERSRRYRLAADRDRFTLATALLRVVAGWAVGVNPSVVVVDRTCESCGEPHGRPRLPRTPLEASISHSGDAVVVAITRAGPVGVDIEQLGAADHTDLVTTVCTGSEQRNLVTPTDFYVYWTRKEAVLKATGEGLGRTMASIEVTPPKARPALISIDGAPDMACQMFDIHLEGYAGAVAVVRDAGISFDVLDAAAILTSRWPTGRL